LCAIKAQKIHGTDRALPFCNFKVGSHRPNLVQEGVKVKNIFLSKNSFFWNCVEEGKYNYWIESGEERCMYVH
jgi:hypothetical protein